mmetsp:Transcript_60507/g.100047  ORF Transcript_60507/g.100047 Transcript_60507/m.100047 type:complete len:101 (-) Transcript_60507:18-320(-)
MQWKKWTEGRLAWHKAASVNSKMRATGQAVLKQPPPHTPDFRESLRTSHRWPKSMKSPTNVPAHQSLHLDLGLSPHLHLAKLQERLFGRSRRPARTARAE